MSYKIQQLVIAPVLFLLALFFYAVVLQGPVGLNLLLLMAAIFLASSFLTARLRKPAEEASRA
ncbi:hypothetical protein [Arthrobacter rhombi]|uniref:hypothetical protein n=1 Tax=Arthrobacter rhombi TaxID=71253 RepID=UPI003F8E3539